ncbi:uncharacterized protein isoform X2 [Choristoneura fumiferana]|uniref:uncharacterized protein isoform X2 n=1 Tax=Choristoneura fumiferana TaxID=7141 RepID=UPI003D155D6E
MASTTVKEENCSDDLLACRICLASDVKLFHIRRWGIEQVFVDLMGTPLSVCDGFPQHVCVWCRALLLRARELRARCQRAEHLLKDALIHQHYITTSYIRSIDRKLHNLSHTFSQNIDVKVFQYDDIQTETKISITLENNIENYVKEYGTNATYDDDDDLGSDIHSDVKPKIVYVELEDVAPRDTPKVNIVESIDQTVNQDVNTPQLNVKECIDKTVNEGASNCKKKFSEINMIDCNDKSIKKDVKSCKKKFPEINVTECSNETKKKDVKCKRKLVKNKTEKKTKEKKGQAWRQKPFSKEEGFKEFEEKYNFKIVSVSEDDMVKDMENRKESDNYKLSAFKCDLCFKGFLSQNTYDNHMKVHDLGLQARGNECRLCRKRFFRPAGLRDHMRDNHQLKYHCLRCDETINSKYSAEMHAQFHAGKVFQCEHCGQQFRPSCRTCGAARASCALSRQPPSTGIAARSPPASVNNTHSSCTQCGEVCANEQDLLTHRMEQHGLQLFTCDMCNKTFESKESVATHIDRVHRLMKPVQRRPGHRPPPARRPNKQQDAVCEVCGKRSTCMATLKIHMNTHTGARPYKCSLCPKTYVTPHGLKTHEPVHSGARKWSCEECHATFMRQSSLSLHRRAVHSGERAYQCHICCKTFTQSGSLYTHVKYVHMKVKPPPRKRNKKTAT